MDASEALETIASAIEVHYLDGYDASDPVYVVIRDAFRNLITAMVEQKFVTQSDVASSWEENLSVITDNWEPDEEDEYDLSFGDLKPIYRRTAARYASVKRMCCFVTWSMIYS
jgi:hypothetical protein